jgi:hypothetical protein
MRVLKGTGGGVFSILTVKGSLIKLLESDSFFFFSRKGTAGRRPFSGNTRGAVTLKTLET